MPGLCPFEKKSFLPVVSSAVPVGPVPGRWIKNGSINNGPQVDYPTQQNDPQHHRHDEHEACQ